MDTILDFDAHYERVKGEPKKIRVRGQDYELPPDIPVAVMFMLQQNGSRTEAYFMLLATLFGEEPVSDWLQGKNDEPVMSHKEFGQLVNAILQLYYPEAANAAATEGTGDPKAEGPNGTGSSSQ